MKKLLTFLTTLNNLTQIPRSGGIAFAGIPASDLHTISDHSFMGASISLILAKYLNKKDHKLNIEHIITYSLLHDWTDIIMLDIPTGSPSYQSYFEEPIRDIFKKAEGKAEAEIVNYLSEYIDDDMFSEKLTSDERTVVEIADISCLLLEVLSWKYSGKKYDWFDYLWSNTVKRLEEKIKNSFPELKPLITELETQYKTGTKPYNPFLTKEEFQTFKKNRNPVV